MNGFLLSKSTLWYYHSFQKMKQFLRWAMWPMGLLLYILSFCVKDSRKSIWIFHFERMNWAKKLFISKSVDIMNWLKYPWFGRKKTINLISWNDLQMWVLEHNDFFTVGLFLCPDGSFYISKYHWCQWRAYLFICMPLLSTQTRG